MRIWHKWEWLFLGGLLAVALALRLVWLGRVPPGVRFDELVNVRMADHIYAGEWPIYFQEAWGHEPLYHYLHALGMSLLGKTVLGVRITSVLSGVLGVFTAYLAFRELFGPKVAAVAALFLATSFWSLMYSRFGLRHISLPPWIGLAVVGFWRGLRTPLDQRVRGWLWFALGGACMGASLYTYFAGRMVPALFLAFAVYLLIFHRPLLKARWLGLILFFLLPVLMVAPMVFYLRQHPELEQRLGQVGGELYLALRRGDLGPLFRAIWGTLKMFSLQGDPEWLYNISGRPVFDLVSSIPFYGGVLVSLWHWRDPKRAFILLWLALGIAPAMLSWPPASLGHTIAAQQVTFAFPALALVALWRWARKPPRWMQVSIKVLAVVVILVFAWTNVFDYFVRWPRFSEVRREYQAPVTAVARYLEQHPGIATACVSAPYVDFWNPWSKMTFDLYFQHRDVRICWFNGAKSLILPGDRDAFVFLPDHLAPSSVLDADLGSLLKAGSVPVQTGYQDQGGSSFDLLRVQDLAPFERRLDAVAAARVWASAEGPYVPGTSEQQRQELVLPLRFGDRLSLLGYAHDQVTASAGETWQMTTYWRVLTGSNDALSIFVHVLDRENNVVAGWDGLDASPESWREGDLFIQVHTLALPSDVPTGVQRVEIGVYSPVTLLRHPLFVGVGEHTAPYNRAIAESLTVQ